MARPTKRQQINKKISEAQKISEEEKVIIINKLEEAAKWDYTLEDICFHAGISYDTFNRWQKEKPELGGRIKALRDDPKRKARRKVAEDVDKTYQNAIDYLKRKVKDEFSERQEMTGAEGRPLIGEILDEIENNGNTKRETTAK